MELGTPAVRPLINTLQCDNQKVRMRSADALGAIPVGAGVVFGLIRPIWYCCKHQQAQKVETLSCRLLPAITPSIDRRGFDVAVELSLTRPPG